MNRHAFKIPQQQPSVFVLAFAGVICGLIAWELGRFILGGLVELIGSIL
jgi:hypothetical protein